MLERRGRAFGAGLSAWARRKAGPLACNLCHDWRREGWRHDERGGAAQAGMLAERDDANFGFAALAE